MCHALAGTRACHVVFTAPNHPRERAWLQHNSSVDTPLDAFQYLSLEIVVVLWGISIMLQAFGLASFYRNQYHSLFACSIFYLKKLTSKRVSGYFPDGPAEEKFDNFLMTCNCVIFIY